jgi:HEAT repeat protein
MKIALHGGGMKVAYLLVLIAYDLFGATPWELLTQGAADPNFTKRAHAIVALGTIPTAEAKNLVFAAFNDKSPDVRLAAVSALAEQKSPTAIRKLRAALDDDTAEVSFSAARALSDMGDHSGDAILEAVLAGERKQSTSFVKGQIRDAKSTIHNPKKIAWMGAKEGAGFLFGPLGFGLGVVEGMTQDGSAPARAISARLLGQSKKPGARAQLEDSLNDKSPLVRAAVARSLGGCSDPAVIPKIEPLLADKDDAVRYMAAAAIVRLRKGRPAAKS